MRLLARCTNNVKYTNTARYNDTVFMNIYWIDMLVVPIVQFAAKSTQKTAMYFSSEMDRKWHPSNKSRNVIGQTLSYLYTALQIFRAVYIHCSANFEPCAPPSEWRLELRFSYLGLLICSSLTHKYSQPKNANWLDLSWKLRAIFVDSAYVSLHVYFIELCACRGIQLYTNNPVVVIKSAIWRI